MRMLTRKVQRMDAYVVALLAGKQHCPLHRSHINNVLDDFVLSQTEPKWGYVMVRN